MKKLIICLLFCFAVPVFAGDTYFLYKIKASATDAEKDKFFAQVEKEAKGNQKINWKVLGPWKDEHGVEWIRVDCNMTRRNPGRKMADVQKELEKQVADKTKYTLEKKKSVKAIATL